MNTAIVPTNGVEGNITSCKIENQVKSVQQDSIWAYQKTTTYITYDVCNKNVVAEYSKPEIVFGGVFLITLAAFVVIGSIVSIVRAFRWDGKKYIDPWNRF